MRRLSPLRLWRDRSGAGAAEFALVLPVFLLFLLGTIDVGRFIWAVNETEKAVQIGARWAVTTDIIPGGDIGCDTSGNGNNNATPGMKCYSYALSGTIAQGDPVPQSDFPTIQCKMNGAAAACECVSNCPAPFDITVDTVGQAAFDALVARMAEVQPRIAADNITISYAWSGIGYAGDPNGPDVAPIVTVGVTGLGFRPIFLAGIYDFGLPGPSYSLTMEDGDGGFGN